MKCRVCGYRFSAGEERSLCDQCPISKGCPLVRCPNCGYEWPAAPDKSHGRVVPLINLRVRTKGRIASICTSDRKQLRRIFSMGIMPQAKVSVLRRFPSLLFQIGYSQFALDEEIAKYILVAPEEED